MSPAFSTFFDAADMTGCFPANVTVAEINSEAAAQNLYFPLYLDDAQPLVSQLHRGRFMPASHRFGALTDNILGVNFRLASGTALRLGGRTIKNCTGFDLAHFVLNSSHSFGSVTDLVLRLRALPGPLRWFGFSVTPEQAESFRRAVGRSPWWHVLECIDVEVEPDHLTLWLGMRGSEERLTHCENWIRLQFSNSPVSSKDRPDDMSLDWDAGLKTLPSNAVERALALVRGFGGQARIHLTCGFVRWSSPAAAGAVQLLTRLRERCVEEGGHLTSSHLPETAPADEELWIARLEEHWQRIAE